MNGLWTFAVNWADSRILITQWLIDQLWISMRIPSCAWLDVRISDPKRNLDHRSFFSLGWYVNEFIQIIFSNKAHLNSPGVRLLLELCYVLVVKHVTFFTICAKLTMAFTIKIISSLPWTFTLLYPDMVVVSDLNKSIGRSKNRRALADLHTPIHPHPVLSAMSQAIPMPLTCSPNSCVHQ